MGSAGPGKEQEHDGCFSGLRGWQSPAKMRMAEDLFTRSMSTAEHL